MHLKLSVAFFSFKTLVLSKFKILKMSWLLNGLLLLLMVFVVGVALAVIFVLMGQQYWKKRNIYTLKTRVPIIGHMGKMILRKQASGKKIMENGLFISLVEIYSLTKDFYTELKKAGKDFGGIYQLQRPTLVLSNPDLIGEVTTKQFEHFVNRRPLVDQK